eukprot:gene4304-5387_t
MINDHYSELIDKFEEELLVEKFDIPRYNQRYPISLTPYILTKDEYERVKNSAELVIEAVEILMKQYLRDSDIQSYYPELHHVHHLIEINQPKGEGYYCGRWNQFSRFDLIKNGNGDYGIMELNGGCPAGVLTVQAIREVYESKIPIFKDLNKRGIYRTALEDMNFFYRYLIQYYQEWTNNQKIPTLAFMINNKFRPITSDTMMFLKYGRENGYKVMLAYYDQVDYDGSCLCFNGEKIDVAINKFDFYIEDGKLRPCFYSEHIKEVDKFILAVKDRNVLLVNSFPSFFIGENKKTMAVLFDDKIAGKYFNDQQKKAIQSLVLPTYTLNSKNLQFKSHLSEFIFNKDKYVIKSSMNIRGRSVFIGKEKSQEEWDSLIQQCIDGPFIIQKFVKSLETMVLCPQTKSLIPMNTTVAFFIFGGKVSGCFIRSSPELTTNINQKKGVIQFPYITEH